MTWFIFGLFLLAFNIWFAVRDIQNGATVKAGLTWFVSGWLFFDLLVIQLPKLL